MSRGADDRADAETGAVASREAVDGTTKLIISDGSKAGAWIAVHASEAPRLADWR